jgi:hypothetical protein
VRLVDGCCAVDASKIDASFPLTPFWKKRLQVLEAKKRDVLFLCAFSRAPLSADLLRRITAGTARDTDALLEGLEREGWLVPSLDQGVYGFPRRRRARGELLKDLNGSSSLEELLALVRDPPIRRLPPRSDSSGRPAGPVFG